jgi:hypothetical protein
LKFVKLKILALNDALDDRGGRTQGFEVMDAAGRVGWLVPSLRHRIENGNLDLKPGDTIIADDFTCGGGSFSMLAPEIARRIQVSAEHHH